MRPSEKNVLGMLVASAVGLALLCLIRLFIWLFR